MKILPLFFLYTFSGTTWSFLVPNPPGKHNVSLTTGQLVDYSRNDPYAPVPMPRAVMLSIFQPAECSFTTPVPDMPNKTAKYQGPFLENLFNIPADISPLFLNARLPICPGLCSTLEDSPILLFSPGYGVPRLYYNVMASAIASNGFTVITIDHPYDANIIVYPDGHAIHNNASIQANTTWDIYPRASDASFIIDQLSNATAMGELLPQRGSRPFTTNRIAMLGHSAGGAAAVIAAGQDSRIRGAINWDGNFFGAPALPQISQPVLFMRHDKFKLQTWKDDWPQFTGPKLIVNIANTTHQSFSDVPTLFKSAGRNMAPFADLLGTLEPAEMVRILATYTTVWMHGAFEGRIGGKLLQGREPSKFPSVTNVRKGNF